MNLLKIHLLTYRKNGLVFDGFVHSIGFAPSDQLEGNFVDVTTREGFKVAHDISSFSFTALAKASKKYVK